MKSPLCSLQWVAVFALGHLILPSMSAEVIINEISAASSERLLRYGEDGSPRVGWGPRWQALAFDDSDWEVGTSPFGYGNDGLATDVGDQMDNRTPSLYLRQTFTVTADQAASENHFRLQAAADSGFVAFINGHEIARGNLGRRHGFVYHDQSAFSSAEENKRLRYDSEVMAKDVLQEGENVFAVQVQNTVPQQINERAPGVDDSLKFEGDLTLGLGIFAGESNDPLPLADEGWRYRIGYAEPSGGLVDWTHAENPDIEADFSDWIELHNSGAGDVDLSGWGLTDDADVPHAWTFPEGTSIPAGGYLLVLADGVTEIPGDYLHASFGLASDGEFIGLSDADGAFVSQWEDYPRQDSFHSYGVSTHAEDGLAFFADPSPGAANGGTEMAGRVKRPKLSPGGGFYEEATEITITSNTEGAIIRYTTDGSEPTETHGDLYEGPIMVETLDNKTGTVIRVRAFHDGMIPSDETTQTYLVGVDEALEGVPAISFVADAGYAFYAPHGVMTVEGGANIGEDWRAQKASDYYMPDMHGRPFERKVSMEVIYPEDNTNVQMDAGVRLAASAWSRGRFRLSRTEDSPWQHAAAEKPSFNVFFRNDYGDDTLNLPLVENYPVRAFHQLRLRAGKNDIRNPWITDELSRRLMADTGQVGSVGINAALFVNGVYKGYYNAVSRLREELFQDLYGSDAPWQVKHIDVWADGSPHANKLQDTPEWDHLESLLDKDLSKLENYEAVLQELDPINFADYFIVNIYGATWDWPHNNLVIARELSEEGRWRGYMWDAEGMFGVAGGHGTTYNTIRTDLKNKSGTTPSDDLATVWNGLMKSPEWRLTFGDRLQKHFFTPGGALTKENMTRRLDELKEEVAELMRFSGGGNLNSSAIETWISRREDVLFKSGKHFEAEGLWGDVQVPKFAPTGGAVELGTAVKITAGSIFDPQGGELYYTTDGSDPRLPGGDINPSAVLYDRDANTGLMVETSMPVKARIRVTNIFDPTGDWSPLAETTFRVGIEPAGGTNFLISELMVDPVRATDEEREADFSTSNFEFIEFHNPTDVAVDLTDLRFTSGINYVFAEGDATRLEAGAYGVIVNDRAAFISRYGDGVPILGEYNKKLSNGGEHLEISNGDYEPIVSLTYSSGDPWPENAEDGGYSLVRATIDAEMDNNDPATWASSSALGGSPGRAEGSEPSQPSGGYDAWRSARFTEAEAADASVSGLMADPDLDGLSNLGEFAFGSSPKDAQSSAPAVLALAEDGVLTIRVTQRSDDAVDYLLEQSIDLESWEMVTALQEVQAEPAGDTLQAVTYRVEHNAPAAYLRWRVSLK